MCPASQPPWNVILVIHIGELKYGVPGPDYICQDLANNGFAVVSIQYRLDRITGNVPRGQTVPGFAPPAVPNQRGDVQLAVLAGRFGSTANLSGKVTGCVGAVGGSAGASHALWCGRHRHSLRY